VRINSQNAQNASKMYNISHICDILLSDMAGEMTVEPVSSTRGEVGGWGRDPKKCTGRDWGMGSSTI